MGRDLAYQAARRGELPTVRVGRRLLVRTEQLLELLGVQPGGRTALQGKDDVPRAASWMIGRWVPRRQMVAERDGGAMSAYLESRRVAGRSAATGSLTAVVTLRHGSAEQSGGLAWSQDGHIRSCDPAVSNGIQCHEGLKKARSVALDAAGGHLMTCQVSDYGSGGRGFESLPARSKPQNSGFLFVGGHRVVTNVYRRRFGHAVLGAS